ncbi:hypothetical protein COU87_05035 [Candidatus Roizmanbacteria bacterium CG10_big_fil_rev_8_21_14_0_10_39_12]|uniref:Glycosyl transferase family 1 domain-containing protein n=1 Tax=Candidatus Roizmanbacteria bacterium CG10_big_fil_rev_8_21_14_0_10_39_12 TaxID=1974852 RepID=A0A2M8KN64_9BACT|nr:MAG: hypothetical protein COU87_05035 [Candidatus Roizmanbacteria bacterium CG10_big_fil_rev_8_21_14_0_10_39_12]
MKIGVDISQIAHKGTGVARFTEGLVRTILIQKDTTHEWVFFYSSFRQKIDSTLRQKITNSPHSLHSFPFPPSFLSYVSNNFRGFTQLVTHNSKLLTDLDWFITSDWIEYPLSIKKTTIIHDLIFVRHPETVHSKIIRAQQKRLQYISKESEIIFTDSKSTAQDLQEEYKIPADKIVLNYPGVEIISSLSIHDQQKHLNDYHINKPFLLSVGKREPRKNIQRLINVFQKLRKNTPNLQLVIVGPDGWGELHGEQNKNILFLGFVSDEILATLYSNALCFVFPSLYEGFGYPVVEAMKYGCPVATSNTSSLPEIAGEAAVLFDPLDENSIKNSISQLINSEELRLQLIQKGIIQSKKFSWQNYYNTLVTSLNDKT